MAWSTPIIHATGDIVTASDWNVSSNDLSYLYQRPQFQVHLTTGVSIPNGAATLVQYDTVDEDNFAGWSTINHQYTIPSGEGGMWLFTACQQWASNATGVRAIQFVGVAGNPFSFMSAAVDAFGRQVASEAFVITAGQNFFINAYQTSGGALSLANSTCLFSGVRVG